MLRNAIEDWTRGLSEDDRARAVAALAVLGFFVGRGRASPDEAILADCSAERPSGSWSNFDYFYRLGQVLGADEVARAWRSTDGRRPALVRARVHLLENDAADPGLVEWLHALLRHPAAAIAGPFFDVEALARPHRRWRWPLRIGVPTVLTAMRSSTQSAQPWRRSGESSFACSSRRPAPRGTTSSSCRRAPTSKARCGRSRAGTGPQSSCRRAICRVSVAAARGGARRPRDDARGWRCGAVARVARRRTRPREAARRCAA